MSIISYAQNFEDVMLWRALGHIERGMYIDIGAQDPVIDSVSMAFHERGWRGIHVEPTAHYAELLRQQRPSDIVIQAAVSNREDILQFYEISDTGISTADAAIASQHRERGFVTREITVPCVTLESIFKKCTQSSIHWLKIDVEGFEKQVLAGWGKAIARPWIVVVESVLPLSRIETHEDWEPALLAYGYESTYFDGLNRYYISKQHPELRSAFALPPNIFDSFSVNGTASTALHKLLQKRHEEKISLINEQQEQTLIDERKSFETNLALLKLNHSEEIQKWLITEKTLTTQKNELAKELTNLLAVQTRLTEEFSAQLETSHNERLLGVQREHWLSEKIYQAHEQLTNLHAASSQREQATVGQLLTTQEKFNQTLLDLTRSQTEQRLLNEALQAARLALSNNEQIRKDCESAQAKKILNLQVEVQALNHANQLQQQSHTHELDARLNEYKNQIQAHMALEENLQTSHQDEQRANALLHQSIAEMRHSLLSTRASYTWRMTAPLRKLASFFSAKKNPIESILVDRISHVMDANIQTPARNSPLHRNIAHYALKIPIMSNPSNTTDASIPVIASSPASTLDVLLSYYDQQFVECSYITLLGRTPDSEGLAYYLGRVRAGYPKMQIVLQLNQSTEAQAFSAALPGLEMAIKRYKRGKTPLIGWLFRAIYDTESNHSKEYHVRRIENQFFLLNDEVKRCFNQMESSQHILHQLVAQQAQSVVVDLGGTPESTLHSTLVTPASEQRVDDRKLLSPRAKEVYSQLKAALKSNTRRIT